MDRYLPGRVLLFFNTGPTNTVLANVTPDDAGDRLCLNILVIHALGDAIYRRIGLIADHAEPGRRFRARVVMTLFGGIFWLCGIPHLEMTRDLAPTKARRLTRQSRSELVGNLSSIGAT